MRAMAGAQVATLPGGRLHLHHGPIDLVVGVEGTGASAAFARARVRFEPLLTELVRELPRLRRASGAVPKGVVARRMVAATRPFAPAFITPMAAVAGAVADEVRAAILAGRGIDRAYVNNGGDIAFHLGDGQSLTAAIAAPAPARVTIRQCDPWRGIATSGRGGRSHSLGIADSVTVLARNAAAADAAATMIANAVDLPGHPAVTRCPAHDLDPDSDLGARLVTTGVAPLPQADRDRALTSGLALARDCLERGLIGAAWLVLQGRTAQCGALPALEPERTNA